MKAVVKSVEMIAVFDPEGAVKPVRFRLRQKDGEYTVISVGSIQKRSESRSAGNIMQIFDCVSNVAGVMRPYQLRFESGSGKWYLYKM